jgi:aubergine-like protein
MEIIVQKRISERFFSKSQRGLNNPSAGTVVCEDTVSEKYWDFYLVAQKVTQGSCTPSKYTVLYNNTDLEEKDIIELTFGQCANYYNWQGTIKIPAVVKYADLLAYFVATSLESK